MKRHAFAMKIKEGMGGEYRARLGKIWNDLTEVLDMAGICNFSVWKVWTNIPLFKQGAKYGA